MAEEPQLDPPPPNATAEDLKAAAALSNLSATSEDLEQPSSNADSAALGAALSNLSVSDEKEKAVKTSQKDTVPVKEVKKIKIDQADVTFLVQELDISKNRAMEMLRATEGDRIAAVRTYIVPSKT